MSYVGPRTWGVWELHTNKARGAKGYGTVNTLIFGFFMITRCMFAYFWNMIKQVINNFFQSQKGESPINQIKK